MTIFCVWNKNSISSSISFSNRFMNIENQYGLLSHATDLMLLLHEHWKSFFERLEMGEVGNGFQSAFEAKLCCEPKVHPFRHLISRKKADFKINSLTWQGSKVLVKIFRFEIHFTSSSNTIYSNAKTRDSKFISE